MRFDVIVAVVPNASFSQEIAVIFIEIPHRDEKYLDCLTLKSAYFVHHSAIDL